MTMSSDDSLVLRQLIVQMREGQLTHEQQSHLKQLLVGSVEARRLYANFTAMLTLLELEVPALEPEDEPVLSANPPLPLTNDAASASPAPAFGFLGSAVHGAVGFFSQGAPFSYVVATVIVGLGLLLGSVIHVSPSIHLAQEPVLVPSPLPSFPSMVGRITGMVNCRWSDPTTAAIGPVAVPLGRKYALASGLLEITYDSGAKVILQGPCTYEVDSTAGGYLSEGKLTAKVEKRGESEEFDRGGSHSTPYSVLRTSDSALFAVRTPTATVTDLGTEFGVEVSDTGVTKTHVFQGKVSLAAHNNGDKRAECVLLAGQAATLDINGKVVSTLQSSSPRFVRKMPTPEPPGSRELIAQVDYSDTWTANSPHRPGSYLMLEDAAALQVEQCHQNPPRWWVFSVQSALTTWPFDDYPIPWPGCRVQGSKSGFTETGVDGVCYFGFEYGLRDDFVVQFDAVQTGDRINITIGDVPATIDGDKSLSVFFRAPGEKYPEIGVYTLSKLEADTGLRSGISAPFQWHNYAVRFNLRKKQLTVWVDRQCRGAIDLANVTLGMEKDPAGTWAKLPWNNRYVTVGGSTQAGKGRLWTDNFRVGTPREATTAGTPEQQAGQPSPKEN